LAKVERNSASVTSRGISAMNRAVLPDAAPIDDGMAEDAEPTLGETEEAETDGWPAVMPGRVPTRDTGDESMWLVEEGQGGWHGKGEDDLEGRSSRA
jgi:hypothetical protein